MLPELASLEHFHFLRPEWALALIPWIIITLVQKQRQASRDMFGGIIAPHLLEHLRLQRFESRWLNPVNFTRVISVLLLLLIDGAYLAPAALTPEPGRGGPGDPAGCISLHATN